MFELASDVLPKPPDESVLINGTQGASPILHGKALLDNRNITVPVCR